MVPICICFNVYRLERITLSSFLFCFILLRVVMVMVATEPALRTTFYVSFLVDRLMHSDAFNVITNVNNRNQKKCLAFIQIFNFITKSINDKLQKISLFIKICDLSLSVRLFVTRLCLMNLNIEVKVVTFFNFGRLLICMKPISILSLSI